MGYSIEGKLLEACSCGAPCPCWIGADADGGYCNALVAYHYDRGQINGVDVSGLTLAMSAHIPGNILQGNWKVVAHVDDRATPEQKEVILGVHMGKFGGPLADMASLIGEVLDVYDTTIRFDMAMGKGTITIGEVVTAEMEPYTDAQGRPTKMVDTIFSTIPGSPAYVGRATKFMTDLGKHGMQWEYNGRNAVLGEFRFEA
jgi:hypothetical protein